MRTNLALAALALAGAAAIGFSSDKGPLHSGRAPGDFHPRGSHEVAERALRNYYGPVAKTQITSEFDVGGAHVFNATVNRDGVLAEATLTANGDYISMGVPEAMNTITPGAAETAQVLKNPPTSITREDIHGFWITVKNPNNRLYTFEFDATGRIRDIKTSEEIREEANPQRVGGPQSHRVTEVTMKRFSGVQIEGVMVAPHDPGYFMVPFHNKDGHGWAIISEANDVSEWRYPEPMASLPEPVRRSIDHELRGDRIVNVEQGAARLYRLVQNVGGEEVVMLVNSAGAVEWMSSQELHRPTFREYHAR